MDKTLVEYYYIGIQYKKQWKWMNDCSPINTDDFQKHNVKLKKQVTSYCVTCEVQKQLKLSHII